MHVVDRIFLTWYSTDALAASLPAGMVYWTILSFGIGTAAYVNTFVAQYTGAGQSHRVADALWQGIYFSMICGLLLLAMYPLSGPIFQLFGHEPAVQVLEVEYFSLMTLCGLPSLLAATLSCYYSGRSQTVVIMWVNFVGTIVNIVLDYLLIFGFAGLPPGGIRGAAIATVIANFVIFVLYVYLLWIDRDAASVKLLRWRPLDFELFWRLLRFGLPRGFQFFMDVVCFTFFVLLVGEIGTAELAATNLAFNLNTLAFIPMMGLGTAVSTLVGQRIGEQRSDLAVRTTWLAFGMASGYMLIFATIYLFFPDLILKPFAGGDNPESFVALEQQARILLRFVAIYSLFDAWAIIFSSAISGAGDTRFCLLFSSTCGWSIMVIPTYIGLTYFDGGLVMAWATVTVLVIVLGFGFLGRFLQGKWKSMKVIEGEDETPLPVIDPIEDDEPRPLCTLVDKGE